MTTTTDALPTTTTDTVTTTTDATVQTPSVILTPSSTYHYQTLSWLPPSFSVATGSLIPSTIDGSAAPTATGTGDSPQDVPAVIAPNAGAIIPDGNTPVALKFNSLSYVQMVADPLLTAQFVQAIPLLVSSAVDLTPDQIIVVSIISAGGIGSTRRKARRSTVGGIVTTLSIPSDQVSDLQLAIRDPTSNLYSTTNGQLATLLDTTYPLTNNTDTTSNGNTVTDPNGLSVGTAANTTTSGGPSRAVIIGCSIGGATVLYAGMTVVAVRAYRRRKARQADEAAQQNAMFAHSISAPIMNENSLGFTPQW
ncbi:hypothetical protein BC943DRAFT_332765 [Umbelopsis sp. AD052]|nr:hypothetical protein BC943DRAFT_332765 [Umbelopsis sp. AD052]